MERSSGILMPISALPSPYGIGTLGKAAYDFIDFLVKAEQKWWQILPVGPTSYGDSPYQSFSTYAGNPYFIDLELLVRDGLLTEADLDDHGRENAYVREHHTACIMQIGHKLRSGKPHGGRAPDYDDWNLNCDIFFWNDILGQALEISSMGIRVDEASLANQLRIAGCENRAELPFHKLLLSGQLPLTIGGGIGQSRLSMLMMGCAHIGEVQSSMWDETTISACEKAGIPLL